MEKVRVGIIGTGRGSKQARFVSKMREAELRCICSKHPDILKKVATQNHVDSTDQWEKLVRRSDIDAVFVSTPNFLHARMCIAAAREGKHVYVEYPMASTLDEATDMITAASQNRVNLQIGVTERWEQNTAVMKERLPSLGPVVTATGVLQELGGGWYEGGGEWATDDAKSGGPLWLHCHFIDVFRYLIGDICWVDASCWRSHSDKRDQEMIGGTILMGFENGASASAQIVLGAPHPRSWVQIACEEGIFEARSMFRNLHLLKPGGAEEISFGEECESSDFFDTREFIHSIIERRNPRFSAEDVMGTLQVWLAAQESCREKKRVYLENTNSTSYQ